MSSLPLPAVSVRPEGPGDAARIRQVNELAFGGSFEADLVDALRAAGAVTLSMVAVIGGDVISPEDEADGVATSGSEQADWGGATVGGVVGGEIVGHALVTPVTVAADAGEVSLLGLGPVAVLPAEQRQGIGTLLVETILEQLRAYGHMGIVVVGEPEYYHRFGFIPGSRWNLQPELDVPDEAFMALELSPGVLSSISGSVRYRPEFNEKPGG